MKNQYADNTQYVQKEALFRFFSGEASLDERMQIKEWVERSEENLREFNAQRKLFDMINFIQEEENAKHIKATPAKRIQIRNLIKIAAAVILTFLVTQIYHQYTAHDEMIPALCSVYAPAGQRTQVTLPDGTTVWLNACSTLRYPSSFAPSGLRRVTLNGEAYFEVTHQAKNPFIVETDKCDIEVLGTHFNVEAYPHTTKFETCLMEGSVKVTSKGKQPDSVILKPHEKVSLEKGRLKVSTVTDYNAYLWKEGIISIRNQPFSDIMQTFEKYFATRILVKNQNVLKYSYTGKFRQTDGIDYALRILQNDLHFTFHYDMEQQTITIE